MTKTAGASPAAARERVTEHVGVRILGVTEARDGAGPAIDAVLIRAGMSLNRRFYPKDTLRSAVGLYEGKKVMLDHASFLDPESVRNIAAVITQARWDATESGVVATIRPAADLESGQLLMSLARSQLAFRRDGVLGEDEDLFGFSHVAFVTGEGIDPEDGEQPPYFHVEAIEDVQSVDAVAFPAAGGAMTGMTEARRERLIDRLRAEGVLPTPTDPPTPESTPRPPARRKVTIMAHKNKRTFDTSPIVVQAEGIERSDIEPALQAAAELGYQQAATEATEQMAEADATIARLEGERDAAQAELATYREREERAAAMEAIEAHMVERGVPEAARPNLRTRIEQRALPLDTAKDLIDTYAEALTARLNGVQQEQDRDVSPETQETNVDPASDALAVGEAFFRQHAGATPVDDPAN